MAMDNAALLESINITEPAQKYLRGLLDKQDCEGMAVRMFVVSPGTPEAETCLAYCKPGEQQDDDIRHGLPSFAVFFAAESLRYLQDARVDFAEDAMGGQLTIRAPNSRLPAISADSPLQDRINYVLWNDINPQLAAHGGQVRLVEVDGQGRAVLEFGGGCQGCSLLDLTLKDGVEKTLRENVPELAGVVDVTDHSDRSQAYYR